MRGSVVKRGRTWTYVLSVGRDETGRRRQKWVGGFATKKAAEAALTEALGRLQAGVWADPGRQTVGEYLDDWLVAVKPTLDEATWTSYRRILSLWVTPRIGHLRLSALTAARLSKLFGELLESGKRNGQPLSPRSVQYVRRVLGSTLEDAVEWGLLSRNPVRAVKGPKQHKPSAGYGTREKRNDSSRPRVTIGCMPCGWFC